MDYTDTSQISSKCDQIHHILSNPQKFLIGTSREGSGEGLIEQRNELCQILQFMFGYLEFLAASSAADVTRSITTGINRSNGISTPNRMLSEAPLSGITELFVGEAMSDNKDDATKLDLIDVETIWGQVDIQNQPLLRRLKNSVNKMSECAETYLTNEKQINGKGSINTINILDNEKSLIRLVDFKQLSDDESEADDGETDDEIDEVENFNDDEDDDNVNQDEDQSSKRIRERMERTMAQTGEDNDLSTDDEDEVSQQAGSEGNDHGRNNDEEDLIDEAADVLNDGFFDLHDMEAFADSEEDYHMPVDEDDAKEEKRKKNDRKRKPKKSNERFSSEEEEDDTDEEEKLVMNFRRKKFRSDEEIDALLSLYNENAKEEDDSEGDAVINMTAADFFGRPNSKDLENRKRTEDKKRYTSSQRGHRENSEFDDDDDNGSWGEQKDENEDHEWNNSQNGFDSEDAANDYDSSADEEKPLGDSKQMIKKGEKDQQTLKKPKLEEQTKQLESELLAEKPWAMRGETTATARPLNSLLEATPQFEVSSKVAPIVTQEHSESIEAVIQQRILAEDWDDVIPRELHSKTAKIDELPEVSQEKSKLGLGELYERDYLKKTAGYDVDAAEKNTVEEKAKNEMRKLFASLCAKLDALSNYNFAPRHIEEEAEVLVITTPAIAMEEVLPLHVSESRAVAPEEVFATAATKKGVVLKGESERDQIEQKRARRAKKAARRKARKAEVADEKFISRLQPASLGLNNPYEKRKLREEFSKARAYGKVTDGTADKNVDYSTSTKFFKRMQEEVEKSISANEDDGTSKKRKKMNESAQKSSALKL